MRNLQPCRTLIVLSGVCALIAACSTPAAQPTTEVTAEPTPDAPPATSTPDNTFAVDSAQQVVDAMRALTTSPDTPERFITGEDVAEHLPEPGDFDPDAYFDVLTHLSMEPGYSLDYVYLYEGAGGHPVLYARDEQTGNLLRDDSYLHHVQIDGTPEGYFEFAVLHMMGEQFYLFWHALYNDRAPVTTLEAAQAALAGVDDCAPIDLPPDAAERLQTFDFTPTVTLTDETAEVRMITFTLWGGFSEVTYTLNREFPHTIHDHTLEPLITWQCGIAF